ncbi:hypothetical protein [Arsenophonus sp. PmNCSU2021_1]|uniref:hypothetical protein n=1 Tax=Arsenophonus sp. PmNCSU2021_1 TaxID=3118989 RepID=UPI003FA5CE74
MIYLTNDLSWSPDGCNVETIRQGEYETIPHRAQEIATNLGILVNRDSPPPVEEKASRKKSKQQ